jgi:hypothetical protein
MSVVLDNKEVLICETFPPFSMRELATLEPANDRKLLGVSLSNILEPSPNSTWTATEAPISKW